MIYTVEGRLQHKEPGLAIVNVGGVGLGLIISPATFERMGGIGSAVRLCTYLHVREDALQLYGFLTEQERSLFLELLGVSGIGPKLAISVLAGTSVDEFCSLVRQGNVARIKSIPGIGPKTAERLVLEMKGKVDKISAASAATAARPAMPHFEEAQLALQSLGYKPAEALAVLDDVAKDAKTGIATEELIKLALKQLIR